MDRDREKMDREKKEAILALTESLAILAGSANVDEWDRHVALATLDAVSSMVRES